MSLAHARGPWGCACPPQCGQESGNLDISIPCLTPSLSWGMGPGGCHPSHLSAASPASGLHLVSQPSAPGPGSPPALMLGTLRVQWGYQDRRLVRGHRPLQCNGVLPYLERLTPESPDLLITECGKRIVDKCMRILEIKHLVHSSYSPVSP